MSPFGRKLSKSFSNFGRKIASVDVKDFGKKLSTFERKAVNTIDKVAPVLALGATALGHPEIGAAITSGNESIQQIHKSGRAAIKDLSDIAKAKRGSEEEKQATIQFGNNLTQLKNTINPVNPQYQ